MNLTANTFKGGLNMDFDPLVTPNSVLTNCLNGTYLTYNGHDVQLLNDMGNGRVETANLPSGYIPIGTTSFGGIIYIVSYNPLNNQCQIGCFPSPERNISFEDDYEGNETITIKNSDFVDLYGNVILNKKKIKLTTITLNPGDKYKIEAVNLTNNSDCITDYNNTEKIFGSNRKYLRLRVGTIDSSNRIVYLDSTVKWYETGENGYYYIQSAINNSLNNKGNVDDKRNTVSTNYNIYNSKLSGEIYLIAELEDINSFTYTYSAEKDSDGRSLNFNFYWSDNNWSENYRIAPEYIHYEDNNSNEELLTIYNRDERESQLSDTEVFKSDSIHQQHYKTGLTLDKKITEEDIQNNNLLTFTLTPWMEYGKLNSLSLTKTLDLGLLGTGKTEIDTWRYYKADDYLLLHYGFSDYPEDGKTTLGMKFSFYNAEDLVNYNNKENPFEVCPRYTYYNIGSISYSGEFSQTFLFEDLTTSNLEKSGLEEDKLYIVVIEKAYGDKSSQSITSELNYDLFVGLRFLYTNTIFNEQYLTDVDDFNELNFELTLLDVNYEVTENITTSTNTSSVFSDKELSKDTFITTTTGNGTFTIVPSIDFSSDLINLNLDCQPDETNNYLISNPNEDIHGEIKKCECKRDSNNNLKYKINYIFENKNNVSGFELKNITFSGAFRPLFYTIEDSENYGMNFSNGHFYFNSDLILSDEGTIGLGRFYKNDYRNGCLLIEDSFGDKGKHGYSDNDLKEDDLIVPGAYMTSVTSEANNRISSISSIIPIASGAGCNYSKDSERFYGFSYRHGLGDTVTDGAGYKLYKEGESNTTCCFSNDNTKHNQFRGSIWASDSGYNLVKKDTENVLHLYTTDNGAIRTSQFEGLMFRTTDDTLYYTNNFAQVFNSSNGNGPVVLDSEFSPADLTVAFLSQLYRFVTDTNYVSLDKYVPLEFDTADITYILPIKVMTKINVNFTFDLNILTNTINKTYNNWNNNNINIVTPEDDIYTVELTLENSDLIKDKCSETTCDDILVYKCKEAYCNQISKSSTIALNTKKLYVIDDLDNYKQLNDINNFVTRTYNWTTHNGLKYKYICNKCYPVDYFKFPNMPTTEGPVFYSSTLENIGTIYYTTYINKGLYPKGLKILTLDDNNLLRISSSQYSLLNHRAIWDNASGDDANGTKIKEFSEEFSICEMLTANPCDTKA